MRKLWRIFLLFSQHALEYKSRSFVWFLVTLFDASVYLLFWRGALAGGGTSVPWSQSQVLSYYLLLIVAGTFLHVHIEEEVAFEDIQYGRLSQYLTRPFSYFGFKFFQELPWRTIQGIFGVVAMLVVSRWYGGITLVSQSMLVPLVVAIILAGYVLSFIYKMIVGVLAFWTVDFRGVGNLETIVFVLFAGFLVPLHFLPDMLRAFALVFPLAYILYYPILAVQGSLSFSELWGVLAMQLVWIGVLSLLYRVLWKKGLERFSAVGQ